VKCAVRLVPWEDSWRSAHHLSYVSLPRLPVGPSTCRLPVVSPRRARERLGATRLPLYRRAMETSQANHASGGSDALSDVYAQLDWATKRYDDMQRRFEGLREAFDFAGVLKIDLETGEAMLEPCDRSEPQLERACSALTGG
jgi:hypothetical protein